MRLNAQIFVLAVAGALFGQGCVVIQAPPPSSASQEMTQHMASRENQRADSVANPTGEPSWIKSPETVFPANRYLNGVGSGMTPEIADRAAKANLAAIFQARIQAVLTNYESESVVFGQSTTRQQTHQLIRATTQRDLEGVWIAERWSQGKVYYAVALLDRQKAMSDIAAEAAELDRFFDVSRKILEGKLPLIVRKTKLKMVSLSDASDPVAQNTPATATPASAPVPTPTQAPKTGDATAVSATQASYEDVVANAEASFEELDRSVAQDISPAMPEASHETPSEVATVSQTPMTSQNVASDAPVVAGDVVDAPEVTDIYMAQSSRLQKARLAKKIIRSGDKRRELAADFHLISPTQNTLPPPRDLPLLETWAANALRDLKIAVDATATESAAPSAIGSFKSAVGKALASQGMEMAPPDSEADLTIEVQYNALPVKMSGGWHWAHGSIQLNVIDEHSATTIYSAEKTEKKASQIAQEATARLVQYMANDVVHALVVEFINQL